MEPLTGTIISPWHILTAAHCIAVGYTPEVALNRNLNSTEIKVKLGFTTRPWVNRTLDMIFYFFYKIIINNAKIGGLDPKLYFSIYLIHRIT